MKFNIIFVSNVEKQLKLKLKMKRIKHLFRPIHKRKSYCGKLTFGINLQP